MTLADDCQRMIELLSEAPLEGFSIDELYDLTGIRGEPWSWHKINDVLLSLKFKRIVKNHKVRDKRNRRLVNKYVLQESEE